MKLFIINGEKNNVKEINISECALLQDVKYKLDEILNGKGKYKFFYYRLIYKNIILSEHNSIKYYKICENDEIWFSKIDDFLRKKDGFVSVYVFICGRICGYEYLIVKMNDTISTIRSMIESFHSKVINIWNADGKEMSNVQKITDINTLEDYKLLISCNNEEIQTFYYTFKTCCYMHDKRWVDRYLSYDRILDNNKDESIRIRMINFIYQIKQIISSSDTIDDRLNQNLSDLPSSYLNSGYLFFGDMTSKIYEIFKDHYAFLFKHCKCRDDVMKIFATYSFFAIILAMGNYGHSRKLIRKSELNSENSYSSQISNNESSKSIKCILIDALNYFMIYFNSSKNDWQYWLKLWMNQYLLGSFCDDDIKERICESNKQNFKIKLKTSGNSTERFITCNPKTVDDAKKVISDILGTDIEYLYCIRPGGDYKPNDKDEFNDEYVIELVMSMEDIEILRYLAQGGYGEVFLCQDKISGNQFALKKQLGAQNDSYRDISIQCRMTNCGNTMNYLGLYNIDGNICIAMQYMSQGSIRSYLDKEKRFNENDLLKICYQILLQIRDIHKEGIIHRDIKCDNIVIDEHNNAKLIDYGLSKFTEDLSDEKLLENLKAYKPGMVRFMAPEILKCEKYTNKIDIWSFGAAMIEMITGKYPYYYLNDLQAMLRIRNTGKIEFEPPESISQEFIELINLCLNRDPDERPSADQLIQMNIFNKMKIE